MTYERIENTVDDLYYERILLLKEDTEYKFKSLFETLRLKQAQILAEINNLESEYLSKHNEYSSKLNDLLRMRNLADDDIKDNEAQSDLLSHVESKLLQLKLAHEEFNSNPAPILNWSDYGYNNIIASIENIQLQTSNVINKNNSSSSSSENNSNNNNNNNNNNDNNNNENSYNNKVLPIIQSGRISSSTKRYGDMINPNHVAIDPTSTNILISDSKKHCVHIFTSKGEYVNIIPHSFKSPRAIRFLNNILYVIENDYNQQYIVFKVMDLAGKIIQQHVGSFGKSPGSLRITPAFDIGDSGQWYVCDIKSDRVQVFHRNLTIKDNWDNLSSPTCIKIDKNNVYIVESLNYESTAAVLKTGVTIRVLDPAGRHIRSVPINCIKECWYFDIDSNGIFVMSDLRANCLRIIAQTGELLHTIESNKDKEKSAKVLKIFQPKGVCFTPAGLIISISMNETGCLQIF